jgi:hypothetical protein
MEPKSKKNLLITQFFFLRVYRLFRAPTAAATEMSIDASGADTDPIHALIFSPFFELRPKVRKSTDVEEGNRHDLHLENHQLGKS